MRALVLMESFKLNFGKGLTRRKWPTESSIIFANTR